LASVGTVAVSFCSPSLGPTSTIFMAFTIASDAFTSVNHRIAFRRCYRSGAADPFSGLSSALWKAKIPLVD
jgi:hypothetical protein